MRLTLLQLAAAVGIGGTLLAVAVPAFIENLTASKLSEPIKNLSIIVKHALVYADKHPGAEAFPPTIGLTPEEVPKGVMVLDPAGTWDDLTWRALDFRITSEHAFSYQFESSSDPVAGAAKFSATAHGDLDADGSVSTFSVFGEKMPGQSARALPGIYVDRELE